MTDAELSASGYMAVRVDESGRTLKTLARCPICRQLLVGAQLVDEIETGDVDLEQPHAHFADCHQPEDLGLPSAWGDHQQTLFSAGGETA